MRWEGGSIFRSEFNSKEFDLPYFHLWQVNITYKYAKKIFNLNRILNQMLFGMPVRDYLYEVRHLA